MANMQYDIDLIEQIETSFSKLQSLVQLTIANSPKPTAQNDQAKLEHDIETEFTTLSDFFLRKENIAQEFFFERKVIDVFYSMLKTSQSRLVKINVIRCLQMILFNQRDEQFINGFLSSPFLNRLIADHGLNFSEDEVVDYYINFLKSLSLRVNQTSIVLFFNQRHPSFPLLWHAMRFISHPESLVRTSIRNILLSAMKIQRPALQYYLSNFPFAIFYAHYVCFFADKWAELQQVAITKSVAINEKEPSQGQKSQFSNSFSQIRTYYEDLSDQLSFFQELIRTNAQCAVPTIVRNALLTYLLCNEIFVVLTADNEYQQQSQGLKNSDVMFNMNQRKNLPIFLPQTAMAVIISIFENLQDECLLVLLARLLYCERVVKKNAELLYEKPVYFSRPRSHHPTKQWQYQHFWDQEKNRPLIKQYASQFFLNEGLSNKSTINLQESQVKQEADKNQAEYVQNLPENQVSINAQSNNDNNNNNNNNNNDNATTTNNIQPSQIEVQQQMPQQQSVSMFQKLSSAIQGYSSSIQNYSKSMMGQISTGNDPINIFGTLKEHHVEIKNLSDGLGIKIPVDYMQHLKNSQDIDDSEYSLFKQLLHSEFDAARIESSEVTHTQNPIRAYLLKDIPTQQSSESVSAQTGLSTLTRQKMLLLLTLMRRKELNTTRLMTELGFGMSDFTTLRFFTTILHELKPQGQSKPPIDLALIAMTLTHYAEFLDDTKQKQQMLLGHTKAGITGIYENLIDNIQNTLETPSLQDFLIDNFAESRKIAAEAFSLENCGNREANSQSINSLQRELNLCLLASSLAAQSKQYSIYFKEPQSEEESVRQNLINLFLVRQLWCRLYFPSYNHNYFVNLGAEGSEGHLQCHTWKEGANYETNTQQNSLQMLLCKYEQREVYVVIDSEYFLLIEAHSGEQKWAHLVFKRHLNCIDTVDDRSEPRRLMIVAGAHGVGEGKKAQQVRKS